MVKLLLLLTTVHTWRTYSELAIGYTTKGERVRFPAVSRDSSLFSEASRLSLRSTQARTGQLLMILSSVVRRLRSEADHSPRHRAQMKNEWNYTSLNRHYFMTCTEANFPHNTSDTRLWVTSLRPSIHYSMDHIFDPSNR
jgi:hypothetical protein